MWFSWSDTCNNIKYNVGTNLTEMLRSGFFKVYLFIYVHSYTVPVQNVWPMITRSDVDN